MSLVFRAFFAPMQTSLVSPTGMPTKAVYIFLRTLRKLLKEHSPDYVAVAFDLAAPTFRDKLFEKYKANRPAFPEDLSVHLPNVRRFCRALGIPLVEKEGFEADDVIGTLAKNASGRETDVYIVSGDEDLFQLVNERVRVLKPSRGASDGETLCDEAKVREVLGVEPTQVVDWLALTGDPSDNIPGARPLPGQEPPAAPGGKKRSYIGPKGATELIRRFGTLEKVLESFEQVEKQSYRDALRDFRDEAILSKQLATIRADVPLETSLEQLAPGQPEIAELTALCQELGFSSLLRELLEEAPRPAEAAPESLELTTPAALEKWLEPLRRPAALSAGVVGEGGEGVRGRTRELAGLLTPEVVQQGLKPLYDEIELPLASVLADVEATGVRIDPEILARMSGEFEKELAALTREIHSLAGQAFDIDSPKQLGEILFEKLKLPGGKKLKKSGQYSTEASVLEQLAEDHELPRKILEYRTRAKLKSTYVDALPKYINPETGRLHTSFNQTVARTGRLSSSNPNLQNIPIGEEFGLRIRSAFVADEGWRMLSADYSQIELRVLAHMAEDPLLIEAFSRNEDIHSRTAQEIFGVPPGLQTHEHRRTAKAINYGVVYGLSSFGLAARTGTSKTEAQQYIHEYFKRYAKVKEFLDRLVEEARETGQVRTLFGRRRPIPEIKSPDAVARGRAEREAMNTPLQGTAADLMKLAMIKLHARLRREKMGTRMILTVHDELVFEVPEEELDAAHAVVKEEMEGARKLKVPLRVDIGVGKNWKEAK